LTKAGLNSANSLAQLTASIVTHRIVAVEDAITRNINTRVRKKTAERIAKQKCPHVCACAIAKADSRISRLANVDIQLTI
jgi:hypothetical protein